MKNKYGIEVLPEDKIQLTQDQKNLIELAFVKQLPPEDVTFIEKVQKQTTDHESKFDTFAHLSGYYVTKYGSEFGMIYLSAIMGGEKKYKESIKSIEELRASTRIKKQEN